MKTAWPALAFLSVDPPGDNQCLGRFYVIIFSPGRNFSSLFLLFSLTSSCLKLRVRNHKQQTSPHFQRYTRPHSVNKFNKFSKLRFNTTCRQNGIEMVQVRNPAGVGCKILIPLL